MTGGADMTDMIGRIRGAVKTKWKAIEMNHDDERPSGATMVQHLLTQCVNHTGGVHFEGDVGLIAGVKIPQEPFHKGA